MLIGRSKSLLNILSRFTCTRNLSYNVIRLNSNRRNEEVDFSEPIKFSSSKANRHERPSWMLDSKYLRGEAPPKYQRMSVLLSTIVFLVYFFILREENDLDDAIYALTLYEKVEGLEKMDLETCLKHYTSMGLDTREIRNRLKEIEEEEEREKALLKES